jgi:predicted DNA-binding protein (UPF0251 family)
MKCFTKEIDQINEALSQVRQDRRRLDTMRLRKKFIDQNIKQNWAAAQLKVHKRTVLRWLNGQVRAIRVIHAMQLAVLLKCTVEDFTLDHELATRSLPSLSAVS